LIAQLVLKELKSLGTELNERILTPPVKK